MTVAHFTAQYKSFHTSPHVASMRMSFGEIMEAPKYIHNRRSAKERNQSFFLTNVNSLCKV